MSTAEPVIDIRELSRRYGERTAVDGVTLRICAGDVIVLVGANGGGKSTTLRMLGGLLRPSGGNGMVLGADVLRPERAARHRIGYMSQSLALYPELTVEENLRFRAEVTGAADLRQVINSYGLGDRLDTRVSELSGGSARRVQFAASVIHGPALLLLDEPTAGLDARTRRDMWGWIDELAVSGCCVLVSTHDMHEAEQCPLILHFRDGQVEGPLSPDTFIARNRASTLEEAVIAEFGE